jgi:nucleoside 2-deoxyribosyltransferase
VKAYILTPAGEVYDRIVEAVSQGGTRAGLGERAPVEQLVQQADTVANQAFDFIRASDVVIADISGKQPSMFFQLGVAHALGKPIVILLNSERSETVPLDLAAFQIITFDPTNLDTLVERLRRYLSNLRARRDVGMA